MPTLPKRLAVVRAAVAALLFNSHHAGSLYGADDVVRALSHAADVGRNKNITKNVEAELLLRAFAHDAADEYSLRYEDHFHFPHLDDKNILCVRKLSCQSVGWSRQWKSAK